MQTAKNTFLIHMIKLEVFLDDIYNRISAKKFISIFAIVTIYILLQQFIS